MQRKMVETITIETDTSQSLKQGDDDCETIVSFIGTPSIKYFKDKRFELILETNIAKYLFINLIDPPWNTRFT